MFTNILVPFDGSESASRALAMAIEIATGLEPVDVTVLQVASMSEFDYSSFEVAMRMAGLDPTDETQLKEVRDNYMSVHDEKAQERIENYFNNLPENINLKIVVKHGSPRDIIVDYAKDNDIDCIIMGRRGVTGIRATLGSVSTYVLRNTDLPVLVVK